MNKRTIGFMDWVEVLPEERAGGIYGVLAIGESPFVPGIVPRSVVHLYIGGSPSAVTDTDIVGLQSREVHVRSNAWLNARLKQISKEKGFGSARPNQVP
jgi:hypothetical protein